MKNEVPEAGHDFKVIEKRIGIFAHMYRCSDLDVTGNEEMVIISIGAGETQVSVLTSEAERRLHWTAVFGWSSLCNIQIPLDGGYFRLETPDHIGRALQGCLRVYGRPVDTRAFIKEARDHMSGAIGYILDQTIKDGACFDKIALAAPPWLHGALSDCIKLRPHMAERIEDM